MDAKLSELETVSDLITLLRSCGLDHLAKTLRLAKNQEGLYIFGHRDPINGPYYGELP